ncbi:MAG: hypothetical protein ACI3XF_06555 [Eubacteriales bacterium]
MQTKKEKIIIIVCLAITVVVLGLVIFAAVRSNRETPESPSDITTENTTTVIPDIPAIEPSEGEESGNPERPGEVVIDVVKENEKYEKPNEPTIEGDPFIGDGYKEASDEE